MHETLEKIGGFMRKINMILCGCLGRMGMEVIEAAKDCIDIRIVAGVAKEASMEKKFPIFKYFDDVNVNCDVVLDFSHPSCLDSILKFVISRNIPAVICATGHNEIQKLRMKEAAKIVPVFLSCNTSIGINILAKIIKTTKSLLGRDYDIEIIEKHHNKKLDAPSGTALMLAHEVSNDNTEYVYDRTRYKSQRMKNEIGIHTVRCGGMRGEHEIIFANEHETLVFKHITNSRKLFAYGALNAVRFIVNVIPGMYDMHDLIKSNDFMLR